MCWCVVDFPSGESTAVPTGGSMSVECYERIAILDRQL